VWLRIWFGIDFSAPSSTSPRIRDSRRLCLSSTSLEQRFDCVIKRVLSNGCGAVAKHDNCARLVSRTFSYRTVSLRLSPCTRRLSHPLDGLEGVLNVYSRDFWSRGNKEFSLGGDLSSIFNAAKGLCSCVRY
jgi:hypothetical protein